MLFFATLRAQLDATRTVHGTLRRAESNLTLPTCRLPTQMVPTSSIDQSLRRAPVPQLTAIPHLPSTPIHLVIFFATPRCQMSTSLLYPATQRRADQATSHKVLITLRRDEAKRTATLFVAKILRVTPAIIDLDNRWANREPAAAQVQGESVRSMSRGAFLDLTCHRFDSATTGRNSGGFTRCPNPDSWQTSVDAPAVSKESAELRAGGATSARNLQSMRGFRTAVVCLS